MGEERQRNLNAVLVEQRARTMRSSLCKGQEPPALDGPEALSLLASSDIVRNSSTMACVVCDLASSELHVDFRERQPTLDDETSLIKEQAGVSLEKAEEMLFT